MDYGPTTYELLIGIRNMAALIAGCGLVYMAAVAFEKRRKD